MLAANGENYTRAKALRIIPRRFTRARFARVIAMTIGQRLNLARN